MKDQKSQEKLDLASPYGVHTYQRIETGSVLRVLCGPHLIIDCHPGIGWVQVANTPVDRETAVVFKALYLE